MMTNGLETIDIDDAIDFLTASQIESMGIQLYQDVDMAMREDTVQLLNSTLRDGGYISD